MMVQKQLEHNEMNKNEGGFPIYLVCDHIRSPENTGMIFRISEAFGVRKIYFSDKSPKTDNQRLKRASRSSHQSVSHNYTHNLKSVLLDLKNSGFKLIALEITNKSKALNKINFSKHGKIALLLGAERTGISPELLELIDEAVHIPMYGMNSSMNVVNALAIALYEISKQIINE
jgi:tRNA G18 (ribose-2'-O)-methylase SpoU